MTDIIAGAGALAAQLINAVSPVAAEQTAHQGSLAQRGAGFSPEAYEAPLPAGNDVALQPLLNEAGKISGKIQEAMTKPLAPLAPDASPDLQELRNIYGDLRDYSRVELQFQLIGKSLEVMQKNVQTLYQQQS